FGSGQWPLRPRDLIQFGDVAVVVEALEVESKTDATSNEQLRVEATASASWEEALNGLAYDHNRCPRPGEQLLAMLRAGHHLVHLEHEDDLLTSVLNDAVAVLDAQRGAIVLADRPTVHRRPRPRAAGRGQP